MRARSLFALGWLWVRWLDGRKEGFVGCGWDTASRSWLARVFPTNVSDSDLGDRRAVSDTVSRESDRHDGYHEGSRNYCTVGVEQNERPLIRPSCSWVQLQAIPN